jgi:hypothetical protein
MSKSRYAFLPETSREKLDADAANSARLAGWLVGGSVLLGGLGWAFGEITALVVVPLAALVWVGTQMEHRKRMLYFIEWEREQQLYQEAAKAKRLERLEAFRRGERPS